MFISTRRRILITALSCAVAVLLFAGAASAQTETFVVDSMLGKASHTTTFALPSFDSSLGTLESIDLTLKFNLCPIISIYNSSGVVVGFQNASLAVPMNVSGPGALDFNINLTATVPSGVAHPGLNSYGLARSSTYRSEQIDPSLFALWEDQPKAKVNLTMTPGSPTFQGTALGDGLFFGGTATEYGKITVHYTYLATPEPGGKYLSFLVAAAMLLLVVRRQARLGA